MPLLIFRKRRSNDNYKRINGDVCESGGMDYLSYPFILGITFRVNKQKKKKKRCSGIEGCCGAPVRYLTSTVRTYVKEKGNIVGDFMWR